MHRNFVNVLQNISEVQISKSRRQIKQVLCAYGKNVYTISANIKDSNNNVFINPRLFLCVGTLSILAPWCMCVFLQYTLISTDISCLYFFINSKIQRKTKFLLLSQLKALNAGLLKIQHKVSVLLKICIL